MRFIPLIHSRGEREAVPAIDHEIPWRQPEFLFDFSVIYLLLLRVACSKSDSESTDSLFSGNMQVVLGERKFWNRSFRELDYDNQVR